MVRALLCFEFCQVFLFYLFIWKIVFESKTTKVGAGGELRILSHDTGL